MYTLNFTVAEVNISAAVSYPTTLSYCADYISEFDTPDVTLAVTAEDIADERERSAAEHKLEGLKMHDFKDSYLETLALYRKLTSQLLDRGILLFHGSALMCDGHAYIFTAKSGTGKSTHTRMWRECFGERVRMINDDKPLLRIRDDGSVTVYGTPWNGKHRLGENISAPLRAICVLTRNDKNSIVRLSPSESLPHILQQTQRPHDRAGVAGTLRLVDKLVHSIGLYKLGCNISHEAARVAYEGMRESTDE